MTPVLTQLPELDALRDRGRHRAAAAAAYAAQGTVFRSLELEEAPWETTDLALVRIYEHGGRKQPTALAHVFFAADYDHNVVTGYDRERGAATVERRDPADDADLAAACADRDEQGRCLRRSPFVLRGVTLRRLPADAGGRGRRAALSTAQVPNASAAGDVILPDPTDQETVITLALMSLMAYENRNVSDDWVPVPGFNVVRPTPLCVVRLLPEALSRVPARLASAWPRQTRDIGWDSDNLRGYVYANANQSLVVLALKGTTLDFFGGSDTGAKDRIIVCRA